MVLTEDQYMNNKLTMDNISYYYDKNKLILDDISVGFEKGKVYVILGPSGCGKSTLLSLIGGLDIPKSGTICFEGSDINKEGLEKHRRNNVAFVFQNYNLIDYMTPEENVKLTAKQDAQAILQKMGLTADECRRNVLKLSGGQQQRVAIARALASDNPIILADEPTGNLDEETSQEITNILKEAAKEYGRCVIIVTHSFEVARQADVVFRLDHGKIEVVDLEKDK